MTKRHQLFISLIFKTQFHLSKKYQQINLINQFFFFFFSYANQNIESINSMFFNHTIVKTQDSIVNKLSDLE